jgi:hypothetical protein
MKSRSSILSPYERDVNQQHREFWANVRQQQHPFAKHPIFAIYGDELNRASYANTDARFGPDWEHKRAGSSCAMSEYGGQIAELERGLREELEGFAKGIVARIYDIPVDRLDAGLVGRREVDFGPLRAKSPIPSPAMLRDPNFRKEVNKRITANNLTHGAATHAGMTVFYKVKEFLDFVSPVLCELYEGQARIIHASYWWYDSNDYGKDFAGGVQLARDSKGALFVHAQAVDFSLLIHELIKGVMELISLRGLSDLDRETRYAVRAIADDFSHEHLHIQTGPELWRRLLPLVPKGMKLAEFMNVLYRFPSDELHCVLSQAIDDRPRAKETLSRMMGR